MLVVPRHLLALDVPRMASRRIWSLNILGWPACSPLNPPSALFEDDDNVHFAGIKASPQLPQWGLPASSASLNVSHPSPWTCACPVCLGIHHLIFFFCWCYCLSSLNFPAEHRSLGGLRAALARKKLRQRKYLNFFIDPHYWVVPSIQQKAHSIPGLPFPDGVLTKVLIVLHRLFSASVAVEIWLFLLPAWAMLPYSSEVSCPHFHFS